MYKIPVTVVTGFLGAGKTTLVRHLLQNNCGRRIAVLVNEFGEVGIDGELLRDCQICDDDRDSTNPVDTIVELTNGCLCCTVQEEFLPTMQALLQRRDRIDCILIETSGLALPQPLVRAFRWPEIRTGATVDGVVTVVDCEALARGQLVGDLDALNAQRAADPNLDHETPVEELFADQLACADLVLLSKGDRLSPPELGSVKRWLQGQLRPGVKVVPCHRGEIEPAVLLGFNAAVEDDLDARPHPHDSAHDPDHDPDETIRAVRLQLGATFGPDTLVARLQCLVREREVYRIKGFVAVPDKPMRLVLQGVGDRFDYFYDRLWRADEPQQTQLVAIGHDLTTAMLRDAIAPPAEVPISSQVPRENAVRST